MRIYITGVFVDDQAKALDFYTNKLGFEIKHDIPVGEHRWLTLVSPVDREGTQLLLEPNVHRAVPPYLAALKEDGIPAASFQVENVAEEFKRLAHMGVEFTQEPTDAGDVVLATLDDTCGNLVQIIEFRPKED